MDVVQQVCKIRWKIEEFNRELKQLTGIESCQCRKARIQRNHIACAILVWLRLKDIAYKTGQTIYQIKYRLLSDYLIHVLDHLLHFPSPDSSIFRIIHFANKLHAYFLQNPS